MTQAPVVLIHGFGEDHTIWNGIIENLANDFRFLAVKVPGSLSPLPSSGDASMEILAEAIVTEMNDAGIGAATIIGHSMGGYIALALAEKYPEKITALGLFHSTAYADNEEKKETRRKGIRVIKEKGDAAFLKTAVPGLFYQPEKFQHEVEGLIRGADRFAPGALAAYYEGMMNRPDRTQVLKAFDGPVLFIGGRHDKAVPADQLLEQSHLPALSFVDMLEDTAHMGMLEEWRQVVVIIRKFFTGIVNFILPTSNPTIESND